MFIFLIFIILFFIGIGYGIVSHKSIDVIIELNSLNSPYYEFGIRFHSPFKGIEELTIGGIFINIHIRFYKEYL